MKSSVRRVVTGHGPDHKAIVAAVEMLPLDALRPGQEGCVVWATERVPADNLDPADGAGKAQGTILREGAVFRVVRYAAGTSGRMHRTESLDFAVVLSGTIVLQLDGGAEVELQQGDLLVQRGTAHAWINRGSDSCTIAFVLIHALPLPPA